MQHLADEALKQAKTEKKPRRNIQYKDIGKRPPSLLDFMAGPAGSLADRLPQQMRPTTRTTWSS